MVVHSFNEADALLRLVRSSAPFASRIREWVVVDHRSSDDTPGAIDEIRTLCTRMNVGLVTERIDRDFGPGFVFADLRQAACDMATSKVVAVQDADFIFGPRYGALLDAATEALTLQGPAYFGIAHCWPQVWDRLKTDHAGTIISHGRVRTHVRRVAIYLRRYARFRQLANGGEWEKLVPIGRRKAQFNIGRKRQASAVRDMLVSVNVKQPERIALRSTMLGYMRAVVHGVERAGWLDAYERGDLPIQPDYDEWYSADLRGWRTHVPNLDLSTSEAVCA
jgi:hypothetical protein